MSNKFLVAVGTVTAFGLIASTPVQAANFGDIMNPGKWFGGSNNRDWDDYYGPGYGHRGYGYPGYGYPGYGYGGYPGYGYGGYPGYGYGGYPGYGAPAQGGGGTTQAPPPAPQ